MTLRRSLRASARNLQAFYGLSQPYKFARALPFIVGVMLVTAVASTAIGATLLGALSWGTFRSVFFVYVFLLALLAAVLSFAPRWSWWLSALCSLELLLGFGSQLLADANLFVRVPLLPLNESV